MTSEKPTAEAERATTDRGGFADKVPAPDPAAAPLGTDDEAAGQPSGGDARGPRPRAAQRSAAIKAGPAPSGREWWIGVPVLLVLAALGAGWLWMG
jgi:hypothetical protein